MRRVVRFFREEPSDPPGWVDGAPTSANGRHCVVCGAAATWVHPLDQDRARFRQGGKGHTLGDHWCLCDSCETTYQASDDEVLGHHHDRAVRRGHRRRPRGTTTAGGLPHADRGARRLDPPHPDLLRLREQGFEPLHDHTGATEEVEVAWPAEHRAELSPEPSPIPTCAGSSAPPTPAAPSSTPSTR